MNIFRNLLRSVLGFHGYRRRHRWHEPENNFDFRQDDVQHKRVFQVYVLKTDYGHYVGHTGNIRARLRAHLADEVCSTAGGNPKLIWQSHPLKSRQDATRFEAALKSLRDNRKNEFKKYTGLVPEPYQYH